MCLFLVPKERGVREIMFGVLAGFLRNVVSGEHLQICQHVDGPDLLPGCLPHHGHLCKESLSYTPSRFDQFCYLKYPLTGWICLAAFWS